MRHVFAAATLVAAILLPATPAAAACPDPGSRQPSPLPAPTRTPGTASFTGGGWGHGIGMSQYGAWGAAELGCPHDQILAGYYPDTNVVERSNLKDLRVGLLFSGSTARSSSTITNTGPDPVNWFFNTNLIIEQQPGQAVKATLLSGPRLRLSVDGTTAWTQPSGGDATVAAVLRPNRRVQIAGKTARGETITYNRGQLKLEVGETAGTTFEHVIAVPMEDYLLGLNEMPYSWPDAALKAQAVAGRSFAHAAAGAWRSRCGTCTLYDSVSDQVYTAGLEQVERPGWWREWRDAVRGTARQVVVTSSGNVATTFYSSSNGGGTQSLSEAWNSTDRDYLAPRNTARWEEARSDRNSRHRWTRNWSGKPIADTFGLEVLRNVTVTDRTVTGRADTVRVAGWQADGDPASATLTTESSMRSTFGLYSNNFDVTWTHPATRRLQGANRHATAAAVSRRGWAGGASTVVIARSDDPTDALGGVAAAGDLGAPLLLTRSGSLHPGTRDEVNRLGATTAVLLGGRQALSDTVRDELLGKTGVTSVRRLAGANRFETMAAVARDIGVGGHDTAFIVRATRVSAHNAGWADALAVSGAAASRAADGRPSPVLGVGASGIPQPTRSALNDLGVERVVVIGGGSVVGSGQVDALEAMGLEVTRRAGANRYLTSIKVARVDTGSGRPVVIATGTDFPDGLAAGAYAARVDGTLLLVPDRFDRGRTPWRSGELPALLDDLSHGHDRTDAVGGSQAVAPREHRAVAWYLSPKGGAGTSTSSLDASTGTTPDGLDPQSDVGSSDLVATRD